MSIIRSRPPLPNPPPPQQKSKQTNETQENISLEFFLFQEDRDVSTFDVELVKDSRGLGITIAGYVEQTSPGSFVNVFLAGICSCSFYVYTLCISWTLADFYRSCVSKILSKFKWLYMYTVAASKLGEKYWN